MKNGPQGPVFFRAMEVGAVIAEPVSPFLFPDRGKFAGNGAEIALGGAMSPSAKPRRCKLCIGFDKKIPVGSNREFAGTSRESVTDVTGSKGGSTGLPGVIGAPPTKALGAAIPEFDWLGLPFTHNLLDRGWPCREGSLRTA